MTFYSSLYNRLFNGNSEVDAKNRLDWLSCDVHNHILPGIDDGAKTIDDSLMLIRGLKELGINRCIATPHIIAGVYDNDINSIKEASDKLSKALSSENIKFNLSYSAEYMIDDRFLNTLDNKQLCVLPNNYVLIEMSYFAESIMSMEVVYRLNSFGYSPILAHPERYNYYHNDFSQYRLIKDMGCYFQLNLLAISGYYGSQVKAVALRLIKEKMYDFVGTDIHHERHLNAIKRLINRYDVQELLKHNPIKNTTVF